MQGHFIDARTGIPYTLVGDYYLPYGDLPDADKDATPIGIWGQRRKRYLRQYRKAAYNALLLSGKLEAHLAEIDAQAEEMLDRLTSQMAVTEGITEQLKAYDQMEWVGRMNNIRHRAQEIVLSTLIHE